MNLNFKFADRNIGFWRDKKMKKAGNLLLILTLAVSMTACGKEPESTADSTEVIEEISVEKDSSIPNISSLSREEILAMTAAEVKASVEEYLPNYRATYKIDEAREMTEEDWLQLRDIICIQLYGSLLDGTPDEVEDNFSDDPDAIYYAPTAEAIEAMDLADFAVYLNNMYAYYYGSEYLAENQIDFTAQDEQLLQEQKTKLIETLSGGESAELPPEQAADDENVAADEDAGTTEDTEKAGD